MAISISDPANISIVVTISLVTNIFSIPIFSIRARIVWDVSDCKINRFVFSINNIAKKSDFKK